MPVKASNYTSCLIRCDLLGMIFFMVLCVKCSKILATTNSLRMPSVFFHLQGTAFFPLLFRIGTERKLSFPLTLWLLYSVFCYSVPIFSKLKHSNMNAIRRCPVLHCSSASAHSWPSPPSPLNGHSCSCSTHKREERKRLVLA